MKLGVVVPTITGREESLERTLDAYSDTLRGQEWSLVTPKDHPNWPAACNIGVQELTDCDVIHYGADDLVPVGDWLAPCLPVLDVGELPAARVWNFEKPLGSREAPTQEIDGPDGAVTRFTRVPILTRRMVEALGPWPEIVYYADVWVSVKAEWLGMITRVTRGYDFVHHWHQHGRLADEGEHAHKEFQRLCQEFARPPSAAGVF